MKSKKLIGISICMLMITTMFSALAVADDWPMFMHDTSHTGVSSSPGVLSNPGEKWSYPLPSYNSGSPVVAGGKVYMGCTDGKVLCLDSISGILLWSYTGSSWISSVPAIADGKLYIASLAGEVYCLDATGNGDGTTTLIWSYTTGGQLSSPAVVDGKIYIGCTDNKVYCLDATGNGDGTTTLIWSYTTGGYVMISPAVADGKVYIGSYDKKVYCLDATSGILLWSYTTGGTIYSSPAVADGKVYIGNNDNKMYCLDATSGILLWRYTTGGQIYSSPAVADGKLYIGSNDKKMYCLDAISGILLWSYTTGGQILSSPAVADGKLYIGTNDKKLYCLDADPSDGVDEGFDDPSSETYDLIWSYTTSGNGHPGSPAVVDEYIYIESDNYLDNRLYCLDHHMYPPNTPAKPSGPTKGIINTAYTFVTSTIDVNEEDQVKYGWDWDNDDVVDDWTAFYDSGVPVSMSHTWTHTGSYSFKVKAEDTSGLASDWSPVHVIGIGPSCKPLLDGPTEGTLGMEYLFTANVSQPPSETDPVQYFFDWGDGNDSYWLPEYGVEIGEEFSVGHSWMKAGDFQVRVKTRIAGTDLESPYWSDSVTIHIEHLKILGVSGGLGITTQLKNVGGYSKDVEWTVELIGGSVPGFHLNKYYNGSIHPLSTGATETISTGSIFGLGRFKISITAECAGEPIVTKTVDGYILFFYVILT